MNLVIKGLMLTEREITIYMESGETKTFPVESLDHVQIESDECRHFEDLIGKTIIDITEDEDDFEITLSDGYIWFTKPKQPRKLPLP